MIRLACMIGLLATPAAAMQCGERDKIVAHLAETYGEGRVSVGLAENGAMVETFASAETGSWTLLVTSPRGLTCLLASGESFETVSDVVPSGLKL